MLELQDVDDAASPLDEGGGEPVAHDVLNLELDTRHLRRLVEAALARRFTALNKKFKE